MPSPDEARKQYEATDPMPEEYRELLIRLLMIQADTETRILFDDWPRYTRFPELAPTLEHRIVMISYLLFNFLGDRAGRYQAEEWIDCSYGPLARVAPGVVKDETGHGNLGQKNLTRICQSPEGRAEGERLLPKWYAIALDMFGKSDSRRDRRYIELGLNRRSNEEARQAFIAEVTPLIEGLGFRLPDATAGRRFL